MIRKRVSKQDGANKPREIFESRLRFERFVTAWDY
jgi:hypothetical protein